LHTVPLDTFLQEAAGKSTTSEEPHKVFQAYVCVVQRHVKISAVYGLLKKWTKIQGSKLVFFQHPVALLFFQTCTTYVFTGLRMCFLG